MDKREFIESAKDISVLYVEDDEAVRESTAEFLSYFFNDLDIAKDGAEGVEFYKKREYDLIISDINMPNLDGIGMVTEIKKLNDEQKIIITSAYGEEMNLIKLIDLGVSKFVTKPIDHTKFMKSLSEIISHINLQKESKNYVKNLEELNKKLTAKNEEFDKSIRILYSKLHQNKQPTEIKKPVKTEQVVEEKTPDSYFTALVTDDTAELEELEAELDYIISYTYLRREIATEQLNRFINVLNNYGTIINQYYVFQSLAKGMKELCQALEENSETFQEEFESYIAFLESFIFILIRWRSDVILKEAEDPNFFDSSMLSDISMIVSMLNGTEDSGESNEEELEFF